MSNSQFWRAVATSYSRIGPPLVPSDEDVWSMEAAIQAHAATQPRRVLLLGATPRLADMRWPDGTMLLAVDSSRDFVRDVWPGDIPGRRRAVQADWRRLPVRDAAYDLVIGDGSLNCLRYPDGIREAVGAVRRALGRNGLLVLRLYVRPDVCESRQEVVQDVAAGRVETFHQFRFRLLMAMQQRVEDGVAVRDVHRYWHDLRSCQDSLPATPGWSREDLHAIEPYRDSPAVHVFPSLDEWRAVLSDLFEEVAVRRASYAVGDRCPIVVWRVRN